MTKTRRATTDRLVRVLSTANAYAIRPDRCASNDLQTKAASGLHSSSEPSVTPFKSVELIRPVAGTIPDCAVSKISGDSSADVGSEIAVTETADDICHVRQETRLSFLENDERKPNNEPSVVIAQSSPERLDLYRSLRIGCCESTAGPSFVYMKKSVSGHGPTEPQGERDAYVVCVHLDAFSNYDVWCDGRHHSSGPVQAGSMHVNDMRHSWLAEIRGPFHVMNFYIPRSALDEIADENNVPRVKELKCCMTEARSDPVIQNLAWAILPALFEPQKANKLFLDHAWRAVAVHLSSMCGSSKLDRPSDRGGLAPWQERKAKDLLYSNLATNLSLPELAKACRLSCSQFSQAFRQTVGYPPHQWLLNQRVALAKELMLNTENPLCDIATSTGFADQSHFTRVFSQRVGISPSAWKRSQVR